MPDQKRELVKAMFPTSSKWHAKVDKMSDGQVYAIYMKIQEKGNT